MDNTKTTHNDNPRAKANTLSVLLWWWTIGLFKKGYGKSLGPEDLYDPLKTDRSSVLGDRLEKKWLAEVSNAKKAQRRPSLLKTVFRTFFFEYFLLGLLQILIEFVLRLGTPILLGALLKYFKPEPTTTYEAALIYAGGISVATALNAIAINQALFGAFHVGGRIRVAVCSVVYRKALKLNLTALGETAPGKVVNLVANDVNRFDLVSITLHHMWSAPMTALIISYFLYVESGIAGLIGMIAVFTVAPIQSYTGKLSSKFRLQTAIKTDERVRLMDEIISGVQVIKMYAWEKPFCLLVGLARKLELKVVRKSSYIRGVYMTFNLFTTRCALFMTLVTILLSGQSLTADKVFVFSSYFNILANTMSGMFVRGFAEIAECLVAFRRLQNFLTFDEYQSGNVTNDLQYSMSNGSFNTGSKYNSTRSLKQDLPYIDEDVGFDEISAKRQSVIVLASDLLKNHANSEEEDRGRIRTISDSNHHYNSRDTWAVKFDHVTAKWEMHSSETTLENINLDVEKGKLYIVIGMVGSGKSSLLSSVLGEINLIQGNVRVKGGISYASQESWIFGASVRQNILFGQEFDRHRYQKVVKVCALLKDFKQFPQGDQTIVGERGGSLSGGQKARVNLARSIYRQADIYLLDDPLSAVDTHVGKHLFKDCIQKYLCGKTRILATHQLQFIKGADMIILMDQGKICQYSDYHKLLAAHPEYSSLIAEEKTGDAGGASDDSSLERSHIRRQFSTSSTRSRTPNASGGETDGEDEDDNKEELADMIEGTSRGTVKGSLFVEYFRVGSNIWYLTLIMILFLITQCVTSFNDYFVTILLNAEEARAYYKDLHEREKNGTEIALNETSVIMNESDIYPQNDYIYVYSAIILSIFIIAMSRSVIFYHVCLRCNQKLHDLVFGALIRANMRFFNTNPSGRILNRFSKDMGAIDELLPKVILDSAQIILMMCGAVVVSCVVNPMFLVPLCIIGVVFFFIRRVYLKTSKNIKRLEGMTRSPVFTHLNATLNGLSTIRAYHAEPILKKEFDKFQDVHSSSWYMFIATSSAFGFSLDIFCFIFTTLVTFSFLILKDHFSGGQVGLAITQVMAMTGMVQWGMRQSAEVSNQLMSVERILEYTDLPTEPNLKDKGNLKKKKGVEEEEKELTDAPKGWPSNGCVKFNGVYMRYAEEEPPVLKGLTLKIKPAEKVGIVGRTGAGKSSLISALFRLAKVEGIIEIDGIDTGTIPLEDLRKSISIIPQDPVLFSGTLRRNLDPFNEFSDHFLWEVLDEVELKDAVTATGHGLENRVLDRGSNYSVGQRQLICLARAILRNNRVLMLDEATANVDPQTDSLIQRTIRTKFAPCTVLTVAHRLNTIMDSDKVLVMDKGRLMEYDHPHILLKNPQGQFTSLVKETGRGMYEQLCKVARDAYVSKHAND